MKANEELKKQAQGAQISTVKQSGIVSWHYFRSFARPEK